MVNLNRIRILLIKKKKVCENERAVDAGGNFKHQLRVVSWKVAMKFLE